MLWSARPQRNHPRTQGPQPQCGLHASPHFAYKRQVHHQLPHPLKRRQPGAAHSHANFEADHGAKKGRDRRGLNCPG